jgi:hypothetical protein
MEYMPAGARLSFLGTVESNTVVSQRSARHSDRMPLPGGSGVESMSVPRYRGVIDSSLFRRILVHAL